MSDFFETKKSTPPNGCTYIGYHPDWIDPDYNKRGTRECFLGGAGTISAQWNDYQDTYQNCEQEPESWCYYPTPEGV